MSFDYKDLSARLRTKFATVANGAELIQRVNFEEAIAERHGRSLPTINQRVLKVLEENVPDIQPHVLTVATMVGLPRGMVNEHRVLDKLSQEARDLYLESSRHFHPASAVASSPETAQILMAVAIVNAEIMDEARQTSYVPYAQVMGAAQDMKTIRHALDTHNSGAPALEKLFRATVDTLEREANNFFNETKKNPPHP